MKLNKIFDFCKEIQDFLKDNCDPYVEIHISDSEVKMSRTIEYMPKKAADSKADCQSG